MNRQIISLLLAICVACGMGITSSAGEAYIEGAEYLNTAAGGAASLVRTVLAMAVGRIKHAIESAGSEPSANNKINVSFNGHIYTATLDDNSSAEAFAALLAEGPVTVSAHNYGNFEKVGDLGVTLPRNDENITTSPGDIILYQGNQITVYYAENTWSFTRLGRIDDPSGLKDALGSGAVDITFSLSGQIG